MRPPEFTGGNPSMPEVRQHLSRQRFNEAAGIHRRKPKRIGRITVVPLDASMRPPEFTGGNRAGPDGHRPAHGSASMRPPEFTGGNKQGSVEVARDALELQ